MTDKLDFSLLADENESLISWEDLFPEYAIGGKSFKSGQKNVPPESSVKPTEYSIPTLPPQDSLQDTTELEIKSQSPQGVNGAETSEKVPSESDISIEDIQLSDLSSSTQTKTGMEVLSLSELPDIPLLMDDDISFHLLADESNLTDFAPSKKAASAAQKELSEKSVGLEAVASALSIASPASTVTTPSTASSSTEQKQTGLSEASDLSLQTASHQTADKLTGISGVSEYDETAAENAWLERALAESDDLLREAHQSEKGQDYWAMRFNQLNFPGMDLMAVTYFGSFTYDLLEQHLLLKRVTRDFVRLLSYNYTMDLRSAGVSEEGIFYMKKGKIPENYTVHLKYPLEYGGAIDFNNMVFMQDKPFHDIIHRYLDEQMVTPAGIAYPTLLYVPTPVGKIYVPFGLFTGSGGKNKQDRSVYAGFSKAAFDKIALKAMPGR